MKLFHWLLTFVLVGLFATCREPQTPAKPRLRLKKVETRYSNPVLAGIDLVFNYTTDKNLANTVLYYHDLNDTTIAVEASRMTYFYDQHGNVAKAEIKPPTDYLGYFFRYDFAYDDHNHITSVKRYNQYYDDKYRPFLTDDYTLEYGSGSYPIKMTVKSNDGGQFDPRRYLVYEYGYEKGNIVTVKYTDMPVRSNGYKLTTGLLTYAYDDKVNPYVGVFPYTFTRVEFDWAGFCPNNVLKSDEIYSYDSNGLLVKSVRPSGNVIFTYKYEEY